MIGQFLRDDENKFNQGERVDAMFEVRKELFVEFDETSVRLE